MPDTIFTHAKVGHKCPTYGLAYLKYVYLDLF